jgi:Family of unknown function (DUF6058)
MSLTAYLQDYFVDKASFASLAGISIDRLEQLMAAEAVPKATYVCDGISVWSAAFGTTPTEDPLIGEYFRPECVRWVEIARQAQAGSERSAVLRALTDELRISLRDYCDCEEAVESRIQSYLPYFFNGTFGLCVADPSTGSGIVRKEMLQETLIALTANGTTPNPSTISRGDLLDIIDKYASSAMPFSPAERERSSRKRVVDDLRPLVAA